MIIDCSACEFQETEHCQDCFVMAILNRETGPVELDAEEEEAIQALQEVGLAPPIRFKRKTG
jgi:hypothetical protein